MSYKHPIYGYDMNPEPSIGEYRDIDFTDWYDEDSTHYFGVGKQKKARKKPTKDEDMAEAKRLEEWADTQLKIICDYDSSAQIRELCEEARKAYKKAIKIYKKK